MSNAVNFSPETIQLLKNFAHINQSIILNEGNELRSTSPGEDMVAVASVPDFFPTNFGIYDLNRFLNNLSIFPNVEFREEDAVMANEMGGSYKFRSTDPDSIKNANATVEFPEADVEFEVSKDIIANLIKMANINSLPHISIESKDGMICMTAFNKELPTTDIVSFAINDYGTDADFKFLLASEQLQKIISGDYVIKVSQYGISSFKNKSVDVEYFIGLDEDSTFNG